MTTTLAHQLANVPCSLNYEDLEKNVVHEVKRRLIDSLGCALGAWHEEPCTIARKLVSDFSSRRRCIALPQNTRSSLNSPIVISGRSWERTLSM